MYAAAQSDLWHLRLTRSRGQDYVSYSEPEFVLEIPCATASSLATYLLLMLEKPENLARLLNTHAVLTSYNICNILKYYQGKRQKSCCQFGYDTWHRLSPRKSRLCWTATAADIQKQLAATNMNTKVCFKHSAAERGKVWKSQRKTTCIWTSKNHLGSVNCG